MFVGCQAAVQGLMIACLGDSGFKRESKGLVVVGLVLEMCLEQVV